MNLSIAAFCSSEKHKQQDGQRMIQTVSTGGHYSPFTVCHGDTSKNSKYKGHHLSHVLSPLRSIGWRPLGPPPPISPYQHL